MEDWLQKYIRVVEAGSFTKAAEQLHISQPALTVAVAKLEKKLKVELIARGVRPLQLTEAGKIVYDAGVAQAYVLDNLQTRLSDYLSERQTVKIGMIDSIASIISTYITPLELLEATNDVSMTVNNSRYLKNAVLSRELDVAFTVESFHGVDVNHTALGKEALLMVCAPNQVEARQAEVEGGYLTQFVSYDQNSMTKKLIIDGLRLKGIHANTTFHSTSPDVIARIVVNGRGVAVLPYLTVQQYLETGKLTVLHLCESPLIIYRSIEAIYHNAKQLSDSLERFLEDIKNTLNKIRQEAEALR